MTSTNSTIDHHPLSPSETPSKARGGRRPNTSDADLTATRPLTSYFTLKHQSEERAAELAGNSAHSYSHSTFRPGNGGTRIPDIMASAPSLAHRRKVSVSRFDPDQTIKRAPSSLIAPPNMKGSRLSWGSNATSTSRRSTSPPHLIAPSLHPVAATADYTRFMSSEAAERVLMRPWHTSTDDEIQEAIANAAESSKPDTASRNPYHSPLRVLSEALENLNRRCIELDSVRKRLKDREIERRQKADELLGELTASDQEVARRILKVVFDEDADGDEPEFQNSYNTISESLSAAMTESLTPLKSNNFVLSPPSTSPVTSTSNSSRKARDSLVDDDPHTRTTSLSTSYSRSREGSIKSSTTDGDFGKEAHNRWSTTSWWPRGRTKNSDAASIYSESDTHSVNEDIEKTVGTSEPSRPFAAGAATMKLGTAARGVFQALGLSTSSTPAASPSKKKRRTHSVASIPSGSMPFFQPLKSPSHTAVAPHIPTPPHLSPPSQTSRHTSISSANNPTFRPPQPPHFRAIVHATRVMTAEPASILVDRGRSAGELVSRLAIELIKNARDEELTIDESRSKDTTKSGAMDNKDAVDKSSKKETSDKAIFSQVSGPSARATLGRALASTRVLVPKKRGGVPSISVLSSPLLGQFTTSRAPPSTESAPAAQGGAPPGQGQPAKRPGTVELESIIPDLSKPPTLFLAQTHGSSLISPSFRPTITHATATRFSSLEQPLTDRYGFIYDISQYDVNLLLRAQDASSTAPACLTGVKIADQDDDDDWPEEGSRPRSRKSNMEIVKGKCELCEAGDMSKHDDDDHVGTGNGTIKAIRPSPSNAALANSLSSTKDLPKVGRGRSSTVTSVKSSHSKPTPSLDTAARTASSDGRPTHACGSTIRKLLSQLTEMHDKKQVTQKADWDVFLKRRRAQAAKPSAVTQTVASSVGSPALFLGFAKDGNEEEEVVRTEGFIGVAQMGLSANKDDWKEFDRLVRNGIPLVYRAKVWLECSGALDAAEPGLFQEVLSSHEGERNSTLDEIEKDVGRTMPLNVFFGGDGVGVGKLRRVLQAYSWRNPAVGYCQGMNLIASTLLLVHANEEDAFWVLTCIVEKLIPPDFFSPSLLVSRACPLVLLDYVQVLQPKLYAHLADMGVDLGAICFSWFLSLYTDCLPVETLFRVWDVLFVEGMDVLFRIALALLRINEAELLACDSNSSLYITLESMTARMWQPDKLLKLESELKASVSHNDIVKRREAHVEALKAVMVD